MAGKGDTGKMVSIKEAEEEGLKLIKRLALLYHYTAEVLVDSFGEEKGRELLEEIIRRYGCEVGITTRVRVEASGLPLTAKNFNIGSDLPRWGWKGDTLICEDGIERERITHCPLAAVWKEKGSEEWGRLYCLVDEAKFEAYNGAHCRHLKNVLDGDEYCLFDVTESEKQVERHR